MNWDDEVDYLTSKWTIEQLNDYILKLEARVVTTKRQITLLKQIRRKRTRTSPKDTGKRGG